MSFDPDEGYEDLPIAYSIDNTVMMHRDVHFGGDFSIMLDYYKKGGLGVCKDFDLKRIEELHETEKAAGQNLSPLMLSGAEAEKVARGKKAYKDLKDIYEIAVPKSPYPKLIADLILAEEEQIQAATDAIVKEKGGIVPSLVELLKSEEFYDPLFPGYGLAPAHAAHCLGLIGDKRAIISLFEAIDSGDFSHEDMILGALKNIGGPAKEFLLKILQGHPITSDNEEAAVALIHFKDPEVSAACLKMLEEIDLAKHTPFATYLVLACESLAPDQRKTLLQLAEKPSTPKMIRQDILAISKTWV